MDVDASFWRDRTVLVTGHTGFKGGWLTLWLASLRSRVVGLSDAVSSMPSLYETADVRSVLAAEHWVDVRDAAAVHEAVAAVEPEVVLHLAAQPFVRRSYAEPIPTFATNVMGTVHLLDAVRRVPSAAAVVVVTSDKCYDQRGLARPFAEDDPMGGHDPYSSSKGAAELVTAAYRRSFFEGRDGPRVGSARAGNVIGGGDWGEDRLVPDIMHSAVAGTPIPIRRPDAIRPWQHVLNPVEGYLLLAQALAEQRPGADAGWNFGPAADDAQPVRVLVERLTARWPGELRWEIDTTPSPHEAPYLALDSSRAREQLGWRPRWDLDRALDAIVEWFAGYRDQADMRALTRAQIDAFAHTPR